MLRTLGSVAVLILLGALSIAAQENSRHGGELGFVVPNEPPSYDAQVAATRGERALIQFRGFPPAERDRLVQALGPKITVQESPGTAESWSR